MHYLDQKFPLEDTNTPLMFDQLSLWSSRFGKLLLDHLPVTPSAKVLDVGCGSGYPLTELAQIFGEKSQLFGVDIWQAGIERTQWKIDRYALSNAQVIYANAEEMPFENDYFDLIVSNVGINNFSNPRQVLSECYRVLQKNQKICITTNALGHFQEFYQVLESCLKELKLKKYIPLLREEEQRRGTDQSIRELFEAAGFAVVKVIKEKFYMRFADSHAFMNHFLIKIGFMPGWRSVLPEKEVKAVFELAERKLDELAEWEGVIKMTIPALYLEAVK